MKYCAALLSLILTGCQSNNQAATDSRAAGGAPDSAVLIPKGPLYSSIKEPSQTAYHFLLWYKKNRGSVGYMNLVENADAQDTTQFYAVDFAATEEYLAEINKSGLVSKAYLAKWQKYFRQKADSLRVHPQNDGPPSGFEFDLVTNSQEPEIYLDNPQKATQRTALITPTQAVVRLDFTTQKEYPDYRFFYLSRTKSRWLIDSIIVK